MTWISTLSSIGMAVGPPLVYADQDSSGFSRDVCAILLIANIARCFFWLGNRFEFPLLIQSILMILAQLALLYICIRYRPDISPESVGVSTRPYGFWQWPSYGTYIEFLAGLIVVLTIVELIFGRMSWFVDALGFFALGLESTLPLPQLYSNYRQKSLYGFRMSTLLGWVGGDNSILLPSIISYAIQGLRYFSVVCRFWSIVAQRFYYGNKPPAILPDIDDIEQALRLAED
ncbi:PQ-loop domain-containing protein [Rhizoctonia solani AG-1 IA]|uniref:PQ-loop domain-containing protein n=1 Tax=Thanatephorus cucumeris (strain AG1-IA) TaxID=983506 RepID=L8X4M9_THACA|nr:PQ-loop domain-containing protein [Rhizoctonia solani AG-1 IA]